MHVDLDRVRTAEAALRAGLEASVTDLRAMCPELFKTQPGPGDGRDGPRPHRWRGAIDLG